MKLICSKLAPANAAAPLLIVGTFENELSTATLTALTSTGVEPLVRQSVVEGFSGKVGETMIHFADGRLRAQRVMLLGLGSRASFGLPALRKALTAAFRQVKSKKVSSVTVAELPLDGTGITPEVCAENIACYAGMVDYVINHQKTDKGGHKPETRLAEVRVLCSPDTESGVRRGLKSGRAIAAAVNHARDLSNEPAGTLTPRKLAAYARRVAEKSNGTIKCTVHSRARLYQLGLNALLAVSRGSEEEPVLIEMTYTPPTGPTSEVLGFVGKSVTFDSGGLNIKVGDGMRTMKRDMAGGATVLAAIGAIAALKLPVSVKVFMAATENMPDGKSYKPGDVIETLSGLTVEIDNTDAEGRLTLADAIAYARQQGVTRIIDLATLTGAVRSVAGDVGAAAYGNTPEFTQRVSKAAETAGERLVDMPMWEEFRDGNKSDMADLKNSGGDPGSATAAWFVREFAGDTPWVHVDIAGCSYRTRELGADPKGSTGYGVRTLIELAKLYC